ncbi:hypothetical protein BGZ83_004672 [Gryganskiella cystojenkinii]|nr:hypothetical protein BGZ83_004672 [Gryganskiella cystojenkinii]
MAQLNQEFTDYNKMYNTFGGDTSYNYPQQPANMHPFTPSQPVPYDNNNNFHNASNQANVNGYGPLDFGYGMTPTTASQANANVNMAPFSASNDATAQRYHHHQGNGGRRRSSIGNFFSGLAGGDNGGGTATASTHHHTRRSSLSNLLSAGGHQSSSDNLGRRRSSAYLSMGYKTDTGGDEHKGPYADVSRSQAQHMARIREAERNLHLTHNVDGLPLPNNQTLGQDPRQPMSTPAPVISNLQRWYIPAIGEFVGTAVFLFLAVGGADAVTRGASEGTAILGVAFAFGMGLMVTAWGFGRISGAHFNPAITLASLVAGCCTIPKAIMYFFCQILGACVGVAMARGTTPGTEKIGQINYLHNGETVAKGFFLEFWLTCILCFVFLMTTEERNRSSFMAPLPIGFTLFSCHLFATRYTNSSINPARAFATSLVSRNFTEHHWIYWFGPFTGGICAAAMYIFFCYFDFDIVTAANKAQHRAEVAAGPGETVTVQVVNASTSAYEPLAGETTAMNRKA